MKTKKVYLATPVGDPTEIDIRRKAEQAKKILESKGFEVYAPWQMHISTSPSISSRFLIVISLYPSSFYRINHRKYQDNNLQSHLLTFLSQQKFRILNRIETKSLFQLLTNILYKIFSKKSKNLLR